MSSAAKVTQSFDHLLIDVRLKRLEALVEAGEALNRVSGLDDILHTILDLITAQINCERATTFLLNERAGELRARQMTGCEYIEIILERGIGIAGHVVECGDSILSNDVQSDPRFNRSTDERTGYNTRNMLCVPLCKSGGKVIGCLQAINARGGSFSDTDLLYLKSFASLATVAVQREQLAQEALRAQLLSTELDIARKIQERMLPSPKAIDLPSPYEAWGISQPCYDVGGDAYNVVILPSGECAFWVADVSGKGIGAALLMTTLQTELQILIRAEHDLTKLAAKLNAHINEVAPPGTYATLFLGVLSAEERALRYVNAGHLPPVRIGNNGVEVMTCEEGGFPVGLFPESSYAVGRTEFAPGERIAIFSDGVTEAENGRDESFNVEGVIESVEDSVDKSVCQVGPAIFDRLNRFRSGMHATDDTTLLLIGLL
ncbi:MAG: SpoIIE family protein phosphatase [Rubrivivax sp.]|nr:SpoIIE family protein phosphatase [Pyrinomonadaceae bacterium]